jgi:phosphatidylglycerol:prolipoprotein diacylglycerol transferase
LHPTPIYEFLTCLIIFLILWKLRKKDQPGSAEGWVQGRLFMLYLIMISIERFSVEFIRLNPRLLFGLSEAQLISVGLFTVGVVGTIYYASNKNLKKYIPPPLTISQKSKAKKQK